MRDYRTPEAAEYRKLYKSSAWRHARAVQLAANPLCGKCEKRGLLTPAVVVNHRIPHKGDWNLFIDPDNHESSCKPCHDGATQEFERAGTIRGCDESGVPLDPRSHWHAA